MKTDKMKLFAVAASSSPRKHLATFSSKVLAKRDRDERNEAAGFSSDYPGIRPPFIVVPGPDHYRFQRKDA